MQIAAEFLVLLVDLLILIYMAWFISEMLQQGKVPPFIRTRVPVAEEVADAFGTLPAGSVLYDLGCGDGRVLAAVAKRNPQARFIGLELRSYPYWLGKRLIKRNGLTNMTILKKNLFKTDVSEATHVYTYLYPKVMDRLLPKLEKELRPGTKLITLDFLFLKKDYVQEIPLKSMTKGKLGRDLYVYEF